MSVGALIPGAEDDEIRPRLKVVTLELLGEPLPHETADVLHAAKTLAVENLPIRSPRNLTVATVLRRVPTAGLLALLAAKQRKRAEEPGAGLVRRVKRPLVVVADYFLLYPGFLACGTSSREIGAIVPGGCSEMAASSA